MLSAPYLVTDLSALSCLPNNHGNISVNMLDKFAVPKLKSLSKHRLTMSRRRSLLLEPL